MSDKMEIYKNLSREQLIALISKMLEKAERAGDESGSKDIQLIDAVREKTVETPEGTQTGAGVSNELESLDEEFITRLYCK